MPFCSNSVNQIGLKAKIKRRGGENGSSHMCHASPPMIVIRWHFWPPDAPQDFNYEFTSRTRFAAHASSRLFSGEERTCRPDSRKQRKSSLKGGQKANNSEQIIRNVFVWHYFDSKIGKSRFIYKRICKLIFICSVVQIAFVLSSLQWS